MVKMVWDKTNLELQSADGLSVREVVVKYKEYFKGISLNFSPIKILERNPVTNLPTRCIQIDWDYVTKDQDEIEFFAPGGIYDLDREPAL